MPFFADQQMGLIRILTDRGTQYCGKLETHDYQLYLGVKGIEHTRTKARHPQTNGICERFHKTILHEFYQVAFLRKLYHTLEELQTNLDALLEYYKTERTHLGKMCCGRTPMQTLLDGKKLWDEMVGQLNQSDRENRHDGVKFQIKSELVQVAPPRKSHKSLGDYDKYLYWLRHLIENAFLELKRWQGIATRYAKNTASFLAAVHIRCRVIWATFK